MATSNPIPGSVVPLPPVAVHGPYEDLAIAMLRVIEKLIDGQTPAQKAQLWQGWIDFWAPFWKLFQPGK